MSQLNPSSHPSPQDSYPLTNITGQKRDRSEACPSESGNLNGHTLKESQESLLTLVKKAAGPSLWSSSPDPTKFQTTISKKRRQQEMKDFFLAKATSPEKSQKSYFSGIADAPRVWEYSSSKNNSSALVAAKVKFPKEQKKRELNSESISPKRIDSTNEDKESATLID